jgi:hypothetical protein
MEEGSAAEAEKQKAEMTARVRNRTESRTERVLLTFFITISFLMSDLN